MSAIRNVTRCSGAVRPRLVGQTPVTARRGFRMSTGTRQADPSGPKPTGPDWPAKGQNQTVMIGAAGLGLGAIVYYLMSSPEKAKEAPAGGLETKNAKAK